VKRWGKSPPPRWQHWGHGKPREVQDQIGGQSRPGSLSAFRANESAPFHAAQAEWTDEPSGRSLDPGREAGARGMIVTAQTSARASRHTEPGLQAHPPLTVLESVHPSFWRFRLWKICAMGFLRTFAAFHDSPRQLPAIPSQTGIVFLDGCHGIHGKGLPRVPACPLRSCPGIGGDVRQGRQRASHLSKSGHPLYRQAGVCPLPSCGVAREDPRTWGTPASRILLPTTGRAAAVAPRSTAGSARREQETEGLETAL